MQLRAHGGQCCGIMHIHGFGGAPSHRPNDSPYYTTTPRQSRLITQLKRHIRSNGCIRGDRGKMFEVVLTDGQIQQFPAWIKELKALDFRLVTRFNNSTGGWCNVFHKTSGRCRDDTVPEWWKNANTGN